MQVDPYLSFNGNCQTAFDRYAQIFGGEITFKMTHGESPMAAKVGPEWQGKIMHATLSLGDRLLQGSDRPPQHFSPPSGFHLSISTKDPAEAERLFAALAEDGTVQMPLSETFWSPRFGMVQDQFGIPWIVNCEPA